MTRTPANQALRDALRKPRSKYGVAAKKDRTLDGIVFDSKGEMERHAILLQLKLADHIRSLARQKRYPLTVEAGGVRTKIGEYVADWTYYEDQGSRWAFVVEDFSGFINALKRWKLKHFEAEYGIKVRITGKTKRRASESTRRAA